MITEHAVLPVIAGQEAEFMETMDRATFLLLVEWETIEAHTEGFRNSEAYQEWRALLHHFYDPFPVVEHFETVATA